MIEDLACLLVRPGLESARLRVTARSDDDAEIRLAQSGRVGRAAAADRVAGWLGGFRLDEATQTLATGTPMVLDIDATFLDDLGGIDAIDDAMRGIDAAGPFLRIMTGPGADPAALIRTPTEPSSPSRLRALTVMRQLKGTGAAPAAWDHLGGVVEVGGVMMVAPTVGVKPGVMACRDGGAARVWRGSATSER